MFILSFGVKDEIMVLDAAVLLFNLSSAAGGQYKSGVHLLILMKPVSLKSKKDPSSLLSANWYPYGIPCLLRPYAVKQVSNI